MRLFPGAALVTALAMAAGFAHACATLSVLTDNSPASVGAIRALTEAYAAANPGVTFDVDQRPGGGEGDTIVKMRLSTGEMADGSAATRARCSRL
jgi:raffinose/stachyose/melibiose transport system substrate-binding protein